MQNQTLGKEARGQNIGSTVLGASVLILMVGGLVYVTSPLWTPNKHLYVIHQSDYINLTNATQAFKFLASVDPN